MADREKITGQSLKGRKLTPKPVNRESTAMEISIALIAIKTFLDSLLKVSVPVTMIVSNPRKINVKPSTIHSIDKMSMLSDEISPNPVITPLVPNRWAIPHTRVITPAI
jgi:hypothetical protein